MDGLSLRLSRERHYGEERTMSLISEISFVGEIPCHSRNSSTDKDDCAEKDSFQKEDPEDKMSLLL